MSLAHLIPGGLHTDQRGRVQHVNVFPVGNADRFYGLHPAAVGAVRGWVGHRRERTWFFAVRGEFPIGVVATRRKLDPRRDLSAQTFHLVVPAPAVLEVPTDHFTAIIASRRNSSLLVFSTGMVDTAPVDDYRLPPDYWRF